MKVIIYRPNVYPVDTTSVETLDLAVPKDAGKHTITCAKTTLDTD